MSMSPTTCAILFADATNLDWAAVAEKGITSAFFASAFGYALWRIGNRLLDSHFVTVAKLTVDVSSIRDSNLDIAKKLDKWPSNPMELMLSAEALKTVATEAVKAALDKANIQCNARDLAHLLERSEGRDQKS